MEGGVVKVLVPPDTVGRIVGATWAVCLWVLLGIGELIGLLGALLGAGEMTGLFGVLLGAGEMMGLLWTLP